jgi:catechol 2,3-dioxygenase-like lactoylglutathione lyase family enzyme
MAFKIIANFHPTLRTVGGLDEARDWVQRVFRRPTSGPPKSFLTEGFPDDYCFTTMIQEVLFDTLDPLRFTSRINPAPEVGAPPHLGMLAWYVDDHDALVQAFNRRGVRLLDPQGHAVEGKAPSPTAPGVVTITDAGQIGFDYEFFTIGNTPRHEAWGQEVDARFEAGWRLSVNAADDPLALECCAWHTLLSDKPERQRGLFVDLLGGRVIHQGPNEALGTESVYVALGDGVYELGRPVREGVAMTDWRRHVRALDDCYHGITFKTADLQKARAHLRAEGVGLVVDEADLVVTDAADSIGVYWGFTTKLIPGDERRIVG